MLEPEEVAILKEAITTKQTKTQLAPK